LLSLLLVGVMTASMLTGCGKTDEGNKDSSGTSEESKDSGKPLVVGYAPFSQKFSPFFADTRYDREAVDMTQTYLLMPDRSGAIVKKGIKGETTSYNGTDYTYTGAADVDVAIDEATKDTTYTMKMRDDIKFSDGTTATIDDVIFSLYAFADTDYDGSSSLYSTPIKGMKAYRANSTAADSVTPEMVTAKLAAMPEELAKQISEKLIKPLLTSELAWVESDVLTDIASFAAAGIKEGMTAGEAFAVLYAKDTAYVATGKDDKTILADVIAQYGSDYVALATNYGDEKYFNAGAQALAETAVIADMMAAGEGEEVPNISGVVRVDDYTMKVTTDGFDATVIYNLGIPITPLHYYGDESLYDYEKNSFGFTRGDLSIIRDKSDIPMGAGPYVFDKFENKTIYFTANKDYFKGTPKTTSVQFKESSEADKIPGVEQGTTDLTDPSGSKAAFEQIGDINGTGELEGKKIITNAVDNLGYGYIGCNADTVNVAGEPSSDASKNLRKAFMTLFSVYRDVNIDSYYGDAASIINYPISNTSWAAPQQSDSDYQIAYSVNAKGEPIYKDGMSADDKYAAALEAALGYFEAAGYTVSGGKVTAAPQGAKLDYEIIIPADGEGNHPSFGVLTDVKAALETVGITLNINDPSDPNVLWNALDAGTQNFFTAAWQATPDPDMYQTYYSSNIVGKGGTNSNHYHIQDTELDNLIMEARSSDDQAFRKAEYKQCLDVILDWAVECPIYQRQNCIIYSPERINADTMTKDVTPFYNWWYEIENVEMK
ncbi:MAG: ABC transporter substrate-binding protein, partial [Lachnospiraceae bacterium]